MPTDDRAADLPRRRGLWALALTAGLAAFPFQGTRGLYESTEGRYAEAAREMAAEGSWFEPRLHGKAHWTKPPLAYWGIAGGLGLLGNNAWGARLSGALCHAGTAFATAALGARLWGGPAGLAAGLVYASSPFPAAGANTVSTDALLTLWETLAVLFFLRGRRRDVVLMWAFFGLGFMTKGPPALLPLLPMALWNRRRAEKVRLASWTGLAAFAGTALPWYAVSCARHPGLLGYFLGREVAGRVASADFHRNPEWYKPFVEYLPALTLGAGGWLLGARAAWKEGAWRPARLAAALGRDDAAGFLSLWIALPLAVFFLSRSRLPLYVLPLFVPVSLLLAPPASRLGLHRLLRGALLQAALLAGIKGAAALVPSKSDMGRLDRMIRAAAPPGAMTYAWREPRLFGLEFYREGRLRRFSPSGSEPWADEGLEEARREIEASPDAPRVFVASPARAEELARGLAPPPAARARTVRDGRWTVIVTGEGGKSEE